MKRHGFIAAAALVLAVGLSSPVVGDTYTWSNTGTNWGTATSWTPDGPPAALGDVAQFSPFGSFGGVSSDPTLNSTTTIGQLVFAGKATGGGYSLSGTGKLTAGTAPASGLVSQGVGTHTIDLGLGGTTSLTLSGATGTTTGGAINLGHGSTVVLTGTTIASLSGSSAISFRGGTLVLDNSGGNPTAQRLTGTGQINLSGGDTVLEFRSDAGGSTFTGLSGILSLGSGDATVRLNQTGSGPLAVTFGSIVRTNTSATVNFTSVGSGTLGGGGANDPSVKFTTAPNLTNGVISNTAGGTALGFAIYNGTDFAGYDATNGVVAVASTAVSGALTSASTQNSNLTGNATISGTVAYNSLKISPSGAGQSIAIASGGVLNTVAILLTGSTDYAITGGSISGGATRYLYVTNPNTTLSVSSSLAGAAQPINKAGDGFLVLTGTTNQVAFASLQNVNLTGGTTRVTSTNFDLTPLNAPTLRFRGGVIEYNVSGGSFVFNRTVGTVAGNVNWSQGGTNLGSGGFSAFSTTASNTLTVNLGGASDPVTWNTGNFITDGYALKFGSTKSNATVIWQNPINLGVSSSDLYLVREINVTRGVGNTADRTQIAGAVSGAVTTDLLKTGTGLLELSAQNTYTGNTLVAGGTLLVTGQLGAGTPTGSVSVGNGAVLAGTGNTASGGVITLAGGAGVFVQSGGAVRGGDPAAPSGSAARVLQIGGSGNLTLVGTASGGGILQVEGSRTGTNAANFSKVAITSASGVLDLAPGAGTKFVIDIVNDPANPLQATETYTATIASVATAGNIRVNGTSFGANQTIPAASYVLQSSAFSFTNVALMVDVTGTNLVLTFTPVPEPTTVIGVAVAGLGLAGLVRRRHRRTACVQAA